MSDELLAAAWDGARAFSDNAVDVSLLIQSENAVFRVDRDGDRPFVLRLHRPGYNTVEEMEGEVTWLEALAGAGVSVHRPMRALDGSSHVPIGVRDEQRLAGAVEWLDGTELGTLVRNRSVDIGASYRQLGELLGSVREHSVAWEPPSGFRRRSWGADEFLGDDAAWGRFWEIPDDAGARGTLLEARNALVDELNGWPTDRSAYGLIHADAHAWNVMVDGDTMTIFDFDDCGFSWFAYELAVVLLPIRTAPWYEEAHEGLLAGYGSVTDLTDSDLERLPALLAIRSMIDVSWLALRPELGQDRLPETIARATADAEAYLTDRSG